MYKNMLILVLLLPFFAHAISDENLIKEVDKLNSQCRGSSGDNPSTIKACDKRDKLVDQLHSKGWCYGHEGQAGYQRKWEKCNTSNENLATKEETTPDAGAGRGGAWFRSAHNILLRNQLENCENYKVAGNLQLYKACRTRTLNGYDFLLERANISKIPMSGWSYCSSHIEHDFAIGGQCVAAVELLCPLDENGEYLNFSNCYRLMTSGAWISNPTIQKMTFTRPSR